MKKSCLPHTSQPLEFCKIPSPNARKCFKDCSYQNFPVGACPQIPLPWDGHINLKRSLELVPPPNIS